MRMIGVCCIAQLAWGLLLLLAGDEYLKFLRIWEAVRGVERGLGRRTR
jgi:hypothetical protein